MRARNGVVAPSAIDPLHVDVYAQQPLGGRQAVEEHDLRVG